MEEEEGGENEAKRRRVEIVQEMNSLDRLSALPDSLLLTILSFLKPVQAGRTCVLSKRWQYIWIELPKLVFSNTSRRAADIRKFVDWGNKTLGLCSGKHLERFEVHFYYKKSFRSHVNRWVKFAVKNKVKYFYLESYECLYELPQFMYTNSYLKDLKLVRCIVEPRRTIGWGSLTRLIFWEVDFCEHVIEKILSGCPVLSVLILWDCTGIKYLKFNSPCLKTIKIRDSSWNGDGMLQISAPYVEHFFIFLNVEGRNLLFTDVSSVVRVHIEFYGDTCGDKPLKLVNYVDELFANFERAKIFEVGHKFIQVLSMLAVEGWRPPEADREFLNIGTISDEKCIPGIVCLLESSPFLRSLVIKGNWCSENCRFYEVIFPDGIPESSLSMFTVACELTHLTIVSMKSFANLDIAGEPMLRLVQLLLWKAVELEEMEIEFGDFSYTLQDYADITEALISFKRSSRDAVVTIKDARRAIIRDGA